MLRINEIRTTSCSRCGHPAMIFTLGKSGPICVPCHEKTLTYKMWRVLEWSAPWLLLGTVVSLLLTLATVMVNWD